MASKLFTEPGDRVRIEVEHPDTGEVLVGWIEITSDPDGAIDFMLDGERFTVTDVQEATIRSVLDERRVPPWVREARAEARRYVVPSDFITNGFPYIPEVRVLDEPVDLFVGGSPVGKMVATEFTSDGLQVAHVAVRPDRVLGWDELV